MRFPKSRDALLPCLGMIAVLAFTSASATAQSRPRLAILPFANGTEYRLDGIELSVADELTNMLFQGGQFLLVERSALQAVMREQGLSESGFIDDATAVSVGGLTGARYVLVGTVRDFSMRSRGAFGINQTIATTRLDARLIDTESGNIVFTASGDGEKSVTGYQDADLSVGGSFTSSHIMEAFTPAIEQLAEQFNANGEALILATLRRGASVVGVSGESYYLDIGASDEVLEGEEFLVLRVVDEIRDADGNLLDEVTEEVGVLRVSRVLERSAIAELASGSANEGDRVVRQRD